MDQSELLAVFLLVFAAGLSSLYVFVQKITENRVILFAALNMVSFILGLILIPFVGMIPLDAVPYLLGSSFAYCCILFFRYHCLKRFDLSRFFAVNAAVLSFWLVLASVVLFDERLNAYGWVAIILTLCGMSVLIRGVNGWMMVGLCSLSGLAGASQFLFDTQGIRVSAEPLTYIVWNLLIGLPVVIYGLWRYRFESFRLIHRHRRDIVIASASDILSYASLLYVIYFTQILHVLPLAKLDIVFTTIIAIIVLKEQQGWRRLAASMLIVSGVLIMQIYGRA